MQWPRAWLFLGLASLVTGCGVITQDPAPPVPLTADQWQVQVTLPSSPRPVTARWRGTWIPARHTWQHVTERLGSVTMPVQPVPAVLTALAAFWQQGAGRWPAAWMPGVPLIAAAPVRVSLRAAVAQAQWTGPIRVDGVTVPAHAAWRAVSARPDGHLRLATWTLVLTSESRRLTPAHGKPYVLPSLTWTATGTVRVVTERAR